jgi:hypothetical protein
MRRRLRLTFNLINLVLNICVRVVKVSYALRCVLSTRFKIFLSTLRYYWAHYCIKNSLRMNWSNNLSKKLRNSYNAMKGLLREINI